MYLDYSDAIIPFMVKKGEVPCLLGNGICPPSCDNYKAAKKIHEASVGKDISDFERRLAVIFADMTPGVDLFDVANAIASCANEVPPVVEEVS